MKKILPALLTIGTLLQAVNIDLTTDVGNPFQSKGQTVALCKHNGTPAIHSTWDASQHNWYEFSWGTNKNTIIIDSFTELSGSISIQAGTLSRPEEITMRFVDKQGEVFQVPVSKISYDASGKASGTFSLAKDAKSFNSFASNPKNKNSKIDLPLTPHGVVFGYNQKSGKGEAYITSISLDIKGQYHTALDTKRDVSINLFTGHPLRVVAPGQENNCFVQISTVPKPTGRISVSATVKDAVTHDIVATTPKTDFYVLWNTCIIHPIPVPKMYGVYDVDIQLTFPENHASDRVVTKRFAYFNPTGLKTPYKNGQFRFGINTHNGSDPARWDLEAKAISTIGARFTRDGFGMTNVMPTADMVNYEVPIAQIKTFRRHGVQPVMLLSGTARWALKDQSKAQEKYYGAECPTDDAWRKFCRETFTRLKDYTPIFEIWNEPDLVWFGAFTPEEYANMAKIAREEINSCAPGALLLSAGFCNFSGKDGFHEKAMALCKDYFDVHCWHGHGPYLDFRSGIDNALIPMRKRIGIDKTMKLYTHETALTATGFSEKIQAEAVWKKIIFAWSRGSIGYTWYDFRNDGFDPANPEHNYGLVTNDYYPKPAYAAYNSIAGLLSGDTRFVEELSQGNTHIFRFDKDGDVILCLWTNQKDTLNDLMFQANGKKAELVDLYGNTRELQTINNITTATVSNAPVAIRFKEASLVTLLGGKVALDGEGVLIRANSQADAVLKLSNPFDAPISYDFSFTAPKGVNCAKNMSVTVPPKSHKTMTLQITAGPDIQDVIDPIVANYSVSNSTDKNAISIQIIPIVPIGKDFPKKPNTIVDSRAQTYEFFDANPGTVHKLRKGPDDLSAALYLAGNDRDFMIKLDVKDDIHHQTNNDSNIWMADSVQIYMEFPNSPVIWQFGCALNENGTVQTAVWTEAPNAHLKKAIKAKVTRQNGTTSYLITVPWAALNATPEMARTGFRLNFLVNDDDFRTRDCYIFWRLGGGTEAVNSTQFRVIKLEK